MSFLVLLFVLSAVLVGFSPTYTATTSSSSSSKSSNNIIYPIAKPNCDDHCGDVSIPFPFGLTEHCYLNPVFFINCSTDDNNNKKTFLRHGNIEVRRISIEGQLSIMNNVAQACDEDNPSSSAEILLAEFYINQTANQFVGVGCNTIATISGMEDERSYRTGCIALCNRFEDVVNGTCDGMGCCQTTDIPILASNAILTVQNMTAVKKTTEGTVANCNYAFVVEKNEFNFSSEMLTKKWEIEQVPLVIDWVISNNTCDKASICKGNTNCENFAGPDDGYRCSCKNGYQGNPYLHPG